MTVQVVAFDVVDVDVGAGGDGDDGAADGSAEFDDFFTRRNVTARQLMAQGYDALAGLGRAVDLDQTAGDGILARDHDVVVGAQQNNAGYCLLRHQNTPYLR
jgi:hypothetical protein